MTDERGFTVQAHWVVGDDERSYAPVAVSTRDEARRVAEEMAETLSHFVGLEILIEPVEPSRPLA